MAKFTFNMPDVGEGVAEAEVVEWHVKLGDKVSEDQHLVDVMTDKATIDIESPVDGTVVELAGEVGDIIAIGAMLLVIEVEGDDAPEAEEEAEPAADPKPAVEPEPEPEPAPAEVEAAPETSPEPAPAPAQATEHGAKVLATPAVRKRAQDLGIDLGEVKPAADGRVRHADLDAFLSYNAGGGFAPTGAAREDEEIKVIGLRKRIAQNMAASKRNIPHFSYVEEVDVTELERMRADLNANRGQKPKLTMLPLLISAMCRLIPDYPMINARYDDEAGIVTRHGSVHLGIAAQTDNGLMVPVLKDAQSKNIWQLAREISRLAEAARTGSAKSDELSGSTLTVTSLGPLGGVATTPVINRPEVAIIGPNRIIERPMYVTGPDGTERIEKRKLMNISISCDHRVVDGYDAASYIQDMKKLIETPVLLLSE
jgi:2-oxoisovalerate dehydrogenase E2 component (dihydrolipoyl transacylase)